MYKMVFHCLLLTALALGFILTKSDGLRRAAQTGDMTYLAQTSQIALPSLTASAYGQAVPWYVKYDPRKLWRDWPRKAELNTKIVRVQDRFAARKDTLAAQLAAQGLSPDVVTVVKLD